MLECVKNLIKKNWVKASLRLAIFIVLIFAVAVGFYSINEQFAVQPVESYWEVLSEPYVLIEKNYEIYEVGYPGGPYRYFIYDNKHKILRSGYTRRIPPKITITHGLVKVFIDFGADSFVYTYYEPEKGLKSESFYKQSIINESDTKVVYLDKFDKKSLVVQDIFDKSKYYLAFEREFSDVENPVTRADFINGDKQLKITYKVGEDEHVVTETLDLY